jgi:hypothetical protein
MGFRPSPYQITQAIGWDNEVMTGDHLDDNNVFRWAEVRMNLPGSVLYDPRVQWVSKVRKEDGRVASDLFIYIDDFRPMAPSEQECWQAARKAGSTLNFLGLQEAPWKYRPGSMTPGPWAESMAYTNEGGGTRVNCQEEMVQREGHYQGSDASDEAVPMVGSQGVGKGERIFNLPLPNIPSNDAIPVGSLPNH